MGYSEHKVDTIADKYKMNTCITEANSVWLYGTDFQEVQTQIKLQNKWFKVRCSDFGRLLARWSEAQYTNKLASDSPPLPSYGISSYFKKNK
jgi:hypothetical protein